MTKTLEQAVLEELHKTGFPTEIVSASVMEGHGWYVLHNPSYLDDSEGRSREFDLRAYRRKWIKIGDRSFSVGIYLMTECKKSEKPWVFFTTPEKYDELRLGNVIKWKFGKRQVFTDNSHPESIISDKQLLKFHHYFQQDRLARTFHEPLKKKERSEHAQMIYSAVMSSIKATLFIYNDSPVETWLRIFYPVIIFSGDLFEAQVDSNKDINLLPAKFLQLSFHYIVSDSSDPPGVGRENRHEFILDIVHESFLSDYLNMINNEHETIVKYIRSAIKKENA